MTKLQETIIEVLRDRGAMTTLQLLECEELQEFWFLRVRLYTAMHDLVEQGLVDIVWKVPRRGFVGHPRYFYDIGRGPEPGPSVDRS